MTSITDRDQLAAGRSGTQDMTTARSSGLLVVRLLAGMLLLVHGIPLLGHPAAFIQSVAALGVPLPAITGSLEIAGEIGLGLALLIGLLSRTAGVLVAVMMGLTWVIVHAPDGLLVKNGLSGESAVVLFFTGVAIALLGSGGYSVDTLLAKVRRSR